MNVTKRFYKKLKYVFFLNMGLIFALTSCNRNKHDIDVSEIEVTMEWQRLDRDFLKFRKGEFEVVNRELGRQYGAFYDRYLRSIVGLGAKDDPALAYRVKDFVNDREVYEIFEVTDKEYQDITEEKKAIEKAFAYYRHYFPERTVPKIVSYVSVFTYAVAATDSVLGIGLDMFLGNGNKLYERYSIPKYIRQKSDRKYLPYSAVRGWVTSEFDDGEIRNDLLSIMVDYGKTLYAMDALFPFADDYLKIGYTPAQIKWCEQNEGMIWARLVEGQKLFSTDQNDIRALTGPGPFSSGFPKESPGQLGFWVGWQIVRAYMDKHPEVTLDRLMDMKDAQKILKKSGYKPVV